MTDHLKTLRELVAAGEKATADKWMHDDGKRKPGKSIFRGSTAREEEDIYGGPSRYGPNRDYIANFLSGGAGELHIDKDQAIANCAFACAAANARPALAALLRVVDAARVAADDPCVEDAPWRDALRAALRDLSPEVEDAE